MTIVNKVAAAEATANTCRYGFIAALVIGFTGGLLVAWQLWHPRPAPIETHASAVQLPKSGAIAIERKPSATPPPKIAAAAKELNRKAKLTRATTLTVQPTQAGCDPLDIDLGLVKLPDNTSRMVVRSDNATVTGGTDMPIITEQVIKEMKWAVGAAYSPDQRTYGAAVDYDFSRVRIGGTLRTLPDRAKGVSSEVRFLIRF